MGEFITENTKERRKFWVSEISKLSGRFGTDAERLESELINEIKADGTDAILDHLRVCGNIPEIYKRDSSEEKLYSKYTDILIAHTLENLGVKSFVIRERSDTADVEGIISDYSFIADAKAFRLSRTAKNQKDFKIQAMDNWKRGKHYAVVVCPIHQLPNKASQIYYQATMRNVCVFSYSHFCLLVQFARLEGNKRAQELLLKVFDLVPVLMLSKSAVNYWLPINKLMIDFSENILPIWKEEKIASGESLAFGKEEAITFLSQERERIMRLSHEEAIKELIKADKIESKIKTIKAITENKLFAIAE